MKRFQWLMVLLALAPALLFAYTGQFSRLIYDDDCNVLVGQSRGVWGMVHHLYNNESGRYGTFLWKGIVAQLDTYGPQITHAVTMVLWLVGWYGLVIQGLAFLKIDHSRRALSIAIAALIVAAASNAFYT